MFFSKKCYNLPRYAFKFCVHSFMHTKLLKNENITVIPIFGGTQNDTGK